MRNLFLHNFGLKLFSLVLATLIWFAIESNLPSDSRFASALGRPAPTREFRRPVGVLVSSVRNQGFTIEPEDVDVVVTGDPAVLRKLHENEIQVYVRLTDVAQTRGAFRLEVALPAELRLLQVQPSRVAVTPLAAD
jgi:YbbR domain-containing protein